MITELTPQEEYAQALSIGEPKQVRLAKIKNILSEIQALDYNHRVDWLESIMFRLPQLELAPVHYFSPGAYAREMTIPKDALVTSKVHATPHLVIVSKGTIGVCSEEYGMQTITAPAMFMSYPGSRRVGFAYEDTVWTTIHRTDKTTVPEVEAEIFTIYEPVLFEPTDDDELVMKLLSRALLLPEPTGEDLV